MTACNLTILIPTHNEEKCILFTITKLLANVEVKDYEILVCDDHSTDNTYALVKARNFKNVRLIRNGFDKGFGNVIRYGFHDAKGEYVVPFMADLSDDPKTINVMYEKTREGYEVVVGSRYAKGGKKLNVNNPLKSICSRVTGHMSSIWHGIPTRDTTNAFKMMYTGDVNTLELTSDGFELSFEITLKLHKRGYKITEVPTTWIDRSEGESKFNLLKSIKPYCRWFFL